MKFQLAAHRVIVVVAVEEISVARLQSRQNFERWIGYQGGAPSSGRIQFGLLKAHTKSRGRRRVYSVIDGIMPSVPGEQQLGKFAFVHSYLAKPPRAKKLENWLNDFPKSRERADVIYPLPCSPGRGFFRQRSRICHNQCTYGWGCRRVKRNTRNNATPNRYTG